MNKNIEQGKGKIEQLTATYDATLIEYNKAIADAAEYNIVKGQTYMNKGLDEGAATSVEECEAMCSANKLCTGATFNEQEQYCRTSSGKGNPTASKDGDYAIISNKHRIKMLEKRLEKLNSQIADMMETVDENELDANDEELNELLEEEPQTKEEFSGSLVENSMIVLRHNKYVYIGLAIGALLLAIITFKLSAAAIATAVTAATSLATSSITSSPITSSIASSINSSPISFETPTSLESPTTDTSMPELLDLSGGGIFSFRKAKFPSFKKITSIPIVIMFLASVVAYLLTKR
jgi:hypothetical protein